MIRFELQIAVKASMTENGGGTLFDAETVAAMASLEPRKGTILTEGAAVYLSAVLQYLAEEAVYLGGSCAGDLGASTVGGGEPDVTCAWHLSWAIFGDGELDELTKHAAIRGSQVYPHIHKSLLGGRFEGDSNVRPSWNSTTTQAVGPEVERERERLDPTKGINPFDGVFASMLELAPGNVLVDPRDGCHYTLNPHWSHEAEAEAGRDEPAKPALNLGPGFRRFIALPDLDAVSAQLVGHRQLMALHQLSESARIVFDADDLDATCVHRLRLRKSRLAQHKFSWAPLVDPRAFGPMVAKLTAVFKTNIRYTREAVDMLQTATEHYMIVLMEGANMACIHGLRAVVCPKDIQLARRVRAERA